MFVHKFYNSMASFGSESTIQTNTQKTRRRKTATTNKLKTRQTKLTAFPGNFNRQMQTISAFYLVSRHIFLAYDFGRFVSLLLCVCVCL